MALRKIHIVKGNNKEAVVYRDSEWQEYRTKFYRGGVYQKEADSHTDDKEDAISTAEHFVKHS